MQWQLQLGISAKGCFVNSFSFFIPDFDLGLDAFQRSFSNFSNPILLFLHAFLLFFFNRYSDHDLTWRMSRSSIANAGVNLTRAHVYRGCYSLFVGIILRKFLSFGVLGSTFYPSKYCMIISIMYHLNLVFDLFKMIYRYIFFATR